MTRFGRGGGERPRGADAPRLRTAAEQLVALALLGAIDSETVRIALREVTLRIRGRTAAASAVTAYSDRSLTRQSLPRNRIDCIIDER